METNKYRFRSSIALVYNDDNNMMHFFKTNTRESIYLKLNQNLIYLFRQFDGYASIKEIANKNNFDLNTLVQLIEFLNTKNILIKVDEDYIDYDINYRLINLLEDYAISTGQINSILNTLAQKVVLIVGMGTAGSYIVDMLCRSGIKNFIIVDDDIVDITNLHRQNMYFENDVGKLKIDCIERELKKIYDDVNIIKISKKLDIDFFNDFSYDISLAINCADFPSVDYTSKIISYYCMKKNIPHIIGGGYNLHLTLVGQSIVPHKTACFECFHVKLDEINGKFTQDIRKLERKNRKIGSFTPLCAISASLSALDAFKILCGFEDKLTNASKRIEFKLRNLDFEIINIPKYDNCKLCLEEDFNENSRNSNK
ncbi:ThiF family adenylyltransferase [Campylobacter coli]|nr:ThiF family adenylyltransferase [Campylobacter coli]